MWGRGTHSRDTCPPPLPTPALSHLCTADGRKVAWWGPGLGLPGTISLTPGRNQVPPSPPSPPPSPLRSRKGWLLARLRTGPWTDGNPVRLAGPGQAPTRAMHAPQGGGDTVALGRTVEASGSRRTRGWVGGARGKAGRPENGLGLQATHSRCSVNAWWVTEHSP